MNTAWNTYFQNVMGVSYVLVLYTLGWSHKSHTTTFLFCVWRYLFSDSKLTARERHRYEGRNYEL